MTSEHAGPLLRALGREVHVWLARADAARDRADLDRCLEVLSPDERARADSFKRERDRNLFVVAHALVRTTLSRYAEVPPSAWTFRNGPQGRPEIAGAGATRGLELNLSHTRGLAACAVSLAYEVGVDVEEVRATDILAVAGDTFSKEELSCLASMPEEAQPAAFFRYWTLKEAYVKARGLGLSLPTNKLTLMLGPDGACSIRFDPALGDDPRDWQLFSARPTPAHVLGLAVRRGRDGDRAVVLKWSNPAGRPGRSV